jgi:tRNA(Ile)-lysidine synthase
VVLYSGGRDSTCLLDCARQIAGTEATTALHVNYHLREDAEGDEQHCRESCARLGLALEVVQAQPGPGDGNTQAWARALRYERGAQLARDRGAELAAGHTADDQLETILYRLASSPSRRALLGMRARQPASREGWPALVRPLLTVTRAQTTAHCRARGLEWRDDPTNDTDTYARGRVRHRLVPALEEIHPAARANVLALARVLGDEAEVLDGVVDGVIGDGDALAVSVLRAQPPALRRLIVQRLADRALGAPAAGVARRADEVAALPETGTAMLDLPRVRVTARRGILTFTAARAPGT